MKKVLALFPILLLAACSDSYQTIGDTNPVVGGISEQNEEIKSLTSLHSLIDNLSTWTSFTTSSHHVIEYKPESNYMYYEQNTEVQYINEPAEYYSVSQIEGNRTVFIEQYGKNEVGSFQSINMANWTKLPNKLELLENPIHNKFELLQLLPNVINALQMSQTIDNQLVYSFSIAQNEFEQIYNFYRLIAPLDSEKNHAHALQSIEGTLVTDNEQIISYQFELTYDHTAKFKKETFEESFDFVNELILIEAPKNLR